MFMMDRLLTCTISSTCDVPNVQKMDYLDSTKTGISSPIDISDILIAQIAKSDSETRMKSKAVSPVASTSNTDVSEMKNTSKIVPNTLMEKSCGSDNSEERVYLGDNKVDIGEDVVKWPTTCISKDFKPTKKAKLGSNIFSEKAGPKKKLFITKQRWMRLFRRRKLQRWIQVRM